MACVMLGSRSGLRLHPDHVIPVAITKENPQVHSRSAGLQGVKVAGCYEILRYLYGNDPAVTNHSYHAGAASAVLTGLSDGGFCSLRTALIVRFAVS
jgi:hypothetical protein